MSGDAPNAASSPRHSIFLSYASADRAAARALRDTLAAAGLEVWLDEEELAGGEAWDTKIRNQIRTCTYFMPIISATTEVRREGYFRREWKLAVERTLDQADDVMFLVPVVIDDTRDAGARVPEKFFTVQWLRAPGGAPTPAMRELAARLAAGDAMAHPPVAADEPETRSRRKDRKAERPPPPFPHFPAYPEPGHHFRFFYNIILWAGHMVHALWMRLPRMVRVIASIVILFNLISWAFRDRNDARDLKQEKEKAAATAALFENIKPDLRGRQDVPSADSIKSLVGAAVNAFQAGRPLAVVTFGAEGDGAEAFAGHVFTEMFKLWSIGEGQVSLSPLPLDPDDDDDDVLARGTKLDSQFVLTGLVQRTEAGTPLRLTVKLYQVKSRSVVWSETFEPSQGDPATIARRIVEAVRPRAFPAAPP
ncbi:MAG TPA: TIR domain-containing protein [Lacunisphaera sp.]|nr:TIR domain-containing protein [Lacunisphaera sp.]